MRRYLAILAMPGTRRGAGTRSLGPLRSKLRPLPTPRRRGAGSSPLHQVDDLLPAGALLVLERRDPSDQPFMDIHTGDVGLIDGRPDLFPDLFGAIRRGGEGLADRRRDRGMAMPVAVRAPAGGGGRREAGGDGMRPPGGLMAVAGWDGGRGLGLERLDVLAQ